MMVTHKLPLLVLSWMHFPTKDLKRSLSMFTLQKRKIKFQVQRSPFTMIHLLLIHTSDQSFTADINSSSQCQIVSTTGASTINVFVIALTSLPFQSANGFRFPFYKPTKGWRFRYGNKPAKTNVSPRSSPLGDVKRLFSQVTWKYIFLFIVYCVSVFLQSLV